MGNVAIICDRSVLQRSLNFRKRNAQRRPGHGIEVLLRSTQMLEVRRSWPNFLFVIPTYTVTATKRSEM